MKDLDNSNVFLTGACTKGLQCPGIRIGWMVASKSNIETLSNFSSFGMGGVSHPSQVLLALCCFHRQSQADPLSLSTTCSQLYTVKLLEKGRVKQARTAIESHYRMQRDRYGEAFKQMGLTLYTGDGGFYHWLELPAGLNASELNVRLFKRGAAILGATSVQFSRCAAMFGQFVSIFAHSPTVG